MSDYNVLIYLGNKLVSVTAFDHFIEAKEFIFEMKQETTGLKFYLTKTLAMERS